jgi:hypothetical protein
LSRRWPTQSPAECRHAPTCARGAAFPTVNAGHGQVHEGSRRTSPPPTNLSSVAAGDGAQPQNMGSSRCTSNSRSGSLSHHQQLLAWAFVTLRPAPDVGQCQSCPLPDALPAGTAGCETPSPGLACCPPHRRPSGRSASWDRQAQASRTRRPALPACCPARRAQEFSPVPVSRTGTGVLDYRYGHFTRVAHPESHLALGGELDGV